MTLDQTCPHCPDGHDDPRRKPWSVWVGIERDGDGQPTALHVAPSNAAHVAESDAEWLRELIRTHCAAELEQLRVRLEDAEIELAAWRTARSRLGRWWEWPLVQSWWYRQYKRADRRAFERECEEIQARAARGDQ